jgi:uncharacterized protein YbjT (DUF2867 family)
MVRALLTHGATVVLLSRNPTTAAVHFADLSADVQARLQWVEADLSDERQLNVAVAEGIGDLPDSIH